MTPRERVRNIIARSPADRCGFWIGNPHPDTLPLYFESFGVADLEGLHRKLGSDLRWITPQYMESTYRHPDGKGLFDTWKQKKSLGEAGPLARCETLRNIDEFDWPSVEYLDFSECLAELRNAGEVYRASGFWAPFFHDVMDLFGVEEFLVRMKTQPDLVHAALAHVCGFYLQANELFFRQAGDLMDGYFFGNDFGTQRELLMSAEQFDEFLLPHLESFAGLAHRHGYQVILHSCGSVHRVIDRLARAGVDCLHPLQARAHRMGAEVLGSEFAGRITFFGGIDTQELLVNGSPAEVREEVRRVRRLLGPHLIISPSHEALLPNIPPANVAAMAAAALEVTS